MTIPNENTLVNFFLLLYNSGMIDTVLFDLDGTLLKLSQETFLSTYLGKLGKVFARLGIDPDLAIKGVWAGTQAMIENDGSKLNAERFWEAFKGFLNLSDEKNKTVESNCDDFYAKEFDTVKEIIEPTDVPKRLVPALAAKGFKVALATNPFFPACAVATRLRWIGLTPEDFILVTHYANSRFCKPNLGYFREVLSKIGKEPHECIMAGNSVTEDMAAKKLGIDTYLVTDYMENETNEDIRVFKHGTQDELEAYLMELG